MDKNTVSINKKMLEKQKVIELSDDIIVPDTKPDIVSITVTNANSYIYKEDLADGKYRFDGNVDAHIVYLSDNGETKCIQTTLDFMDMIEDSIINEKMTTKYRIELVNVEAKVLNERKVSVSVKLKICFSFFECKEIEYIDNLESISGVEKLQESVSLNTIVAENKVKSSLKEEIACIDDEEIAEILRTEVTVENIENKISYNKVLSKADVCVKLLYLGTESNVKSTSVSFPIMNFIDMEKVTDEDNCDIDYKIRNMNFKNNLKNIGCQIDFEIGCEVWNVKQIEIIKDMYGIGKNITFTQKSIEVQTNEPSAKEKVTLNENVLVEDIRGIYDVDCRANILNKTSNGNLTNYEGEVCIQIYFDNGNSLAVKNTKFPFISKMNCDSDDVEVNFVSKHFKLNNEDVVCDVEMELSPNSSNYREIKIIEDIEEEECEIPNDYAMVVYFVKKGDTVWNIARDFKVPMDSIIKVNNLQDANKINVGEKLYIMR